MQTVLFTSTIFGPIHSRRLGTSLGINLMPNDGKVCSFDCLYCEAGFNAQGIGTTGLPTRKDVASALENKLSQMKNGGENLDVITFSGNGEPTLHPEFSEIIDDVISLRDKYFPNVKISVLSNSTRIHIAKTAEALRKVDNNILKLDSAINATAHAIDHPVNKDYDVKDIIARLADFGGKCIVQTMFIRGTYGGVTFDNTTEPEISALIEAYKAIKPSEVMIYSIDRKTPADGLVKITAEELDVIAEKIRKAGIKVMAAS